MGLRSGLIQRALFSSTESVTALRLSLLKRLKLSHLNTLKVLVVKLTALNWCEAEQFRAGSELNSVKVLAVR